MAQSFIPFDQKQQFRPMQPQGAVDPAAGFRQPQQPQQPQGSSFGAAKSLQGGPQGWANQMAQRMGAGDALYGQQQKQMMAAAQGPYQGPTPAQQSAMAGAGIPPPPAPAPPPDAGIMAGFGIQQPPQQQSLQAAPPQAPGVQNWGSPQGQMWGQKNRFIGF